MRDGARHRRRTGGRRDSGEASTDAAGEASAHPTRSFVVRNWIEDPAAGGRGATWRGKVVHVQSGEQRTVESLVGIHLFLSRHLALVGVRPRLADRIRLVVMRLR